MWVKLMRVGTGLSKRLVTALLHAGWIEKFQKWRRAAI